MTEMILHWIVQHEYPAIFGLLAVGIIGIPVPDEIILMYAGFLIRQGDLALSYTAFVAIAGSLCGVTVNYTLGRIGGRVLVERYGRYVRITPVEVEKVHAWFEKVGKWGLPLGYFIPGVRHLASFVAGISQLGYGAFSLFAYTGGVVWVTSFMLAGYFIGEKWKATAESLHQTFLIGSLVAAALGAVVLLIYRKRKRTAP
ncbi:MAG: DedA family protein [Acidobacteriota bacterium]